MKQIQKNKNKIERFLNKLSIYTEYEDFKVDFETRKSEVQQIFKMVLDDKKSLVALNSNCVVIVEFLSGDSKGLFWNYAQLNQNMTKLNEKDGSANITASHLNKILEIMNLSGDAVKIHSQGDYPLTVENVHFKFAVAPRGDD